MGLVTLGCAKNQVDSEYMLSGLAAGGLSLTGDLSRAEAIVVNTCGFIQAAKEESIEAILEAARYKEPGGRCRVLAVVGCLSQRYAEQLKAELPEVDLFLGVGDEQRSLAALLRSALGEGPGGQSGCREARPLRLVETALQGWAYLKIAEGCSNHCSYCAIPLIRGDLVSRPPHELVEEARYLESLGVLELNLIAQDLTAYGRDRGKDHPDLEGLLRLLLSETGIPWIRLLYTHPAHLEEGLLELMGSERRILPYLDLPVQHAADRILGRMGRKTTAEKMRSLIRRARELVDSLVLRTTVLLGYPGETLRDFEALLEFIAEVRFDRLGAFAYSPEEDTPAAGQGGRVPRAEKERRVEMLLELQRRISAERNAGRVGRVLPVLIERALEPGEALCAEYGWAGRSAAHAPEVDGWVYLAGQRLEPGSFARVRIKEAQDYDLFGAVVD
ncbi:MAG: 30S ribosomal protein S12 methylthiotransferase RimO [Candidatus Glassbacteria bacterium]|nr:30S ribosomal protein S12 methylthiotransferase RimO [Candidatus Glassbacteria bacterium]